MILILCYIYKLLCYYAVLHGSVPVPPNQQCKVVVLLVSFSLPFTCKRQTTTSNYKRHKMSRDRAFLRCVCRLHGLFERVDGGLHVQTLNGKRKCYTNHGITSPSPSQVSRDPSAHRRASSTWPRGIKLCTVE